MDLEDEHKSKLGQTNARLHNLMDEQAPPTIYTTPLTPPLSEAALNLTIDFQRQKQGSATSRMIQHPYTILLVLTAFVTYSTYSLGAIIKRSGFAALKWHVEQVVGTVIFTTMFTCVIFHFLNRPTEVIRDNADKIAEESESVFGVDIKEFATLKDGMKLDKKSKEMMKTAENTNLVIYRDTPIAVISLVAVPSLCSEEKFVTKITGAGVRKVYWRSGIIEDLIDWACKRSGILNNNTAPKILVCIEVVSTDAEMKKMLTSKNFQFMESRPINDSWLLSLYGVKTEIWGLPLTVSPKEEIETVKAKVGATGSKRRA